MSEGSELHTQEDVQVTPRCQINSRLFWGISGTGNKSVTDRSLSFVLYVRLVNPNTLKVTLK